MLEINDEIKVLPNVTKANYFEIWNRVGIIKAIRKYKDEPPIYYVEIPGKINEKQIHGYWILERENFELIKEEQTTMITNVLDLYYERKRGEIRKKYDKQIEDIKLNNTDYKFLKTMEEKHKELSPRLQEYIKIDFTEFTFDDETSKKFDEIESLMAKEFNDLNNFCGEVNAMLSECETYEQKQNIYKTYNIIDEKGKLKA